MTTLARVTYLRSKIMRFRRPLSHYSPYDFFLVRLLPSRDYEISSDSICARHVLDALSEKHFQNFPESRIIS